MHNPYAIDQFPELEIDYASLDSEIMHKNQINRIMISIFLYDFSMQMLLKLRKKSLTI